MVIKFMLRIVANFRPKFAPFYEIIVYLFLLYLISNVFWNEARSGLCFT